MAAALDNIIDKSRLTPQTKELVKVIGTTQTYKFLTAFGGRKLHVPKHITDFTHPIALVIGIDDANKVCHKFYELMSIEVPKVDQLLKELRVTLICNDAKTMNINELSTKYNMTRTYIKSIIKNYCKVCAYKTNTNNQRSLFDNE